MNSDESLADLALSITEIEFIQANLQSDVHLLMLQAKQYTSLDMTKMVQQIQARQKAQKKLPEWYANTKLIFPPPLSIEQASSEATARYKASIVNGDSLLDITGGTGIDHYYMSQGFNQSVYCEINPQVSRVAEHNFKVLGATHVHVHHGDFQNYLRPQFAKADWLYADPARRSAQKEKVVLLSDCTPDLVALAPLLSPLAHRFIFKTSPVLDIAGAVEALGGVQEVHIIGLGSECKELLFIRSAETATNDYLRKVRLLLPSGETYAALDFSTEAERNTTIEFADPKEYLYEPHAAVMKAGCYKWIGAQYQLEKLAPSSHLYTSTKLVEKFPGRRFKVLGMCKPDAKEVKKWCQGDKANLTIRNFPGSVNDLRKKLRLKEGGNAYLFATTLKNEKKAIIITEKV